MASALGTTSQYDAIGHVVQLINYTPSGSINSQYIDTYNALGLTATETTLDGSWSYIYDAEGELIHAVFSSNNPGSFANQDLAYNYDSTGNRASTVINGVTTTYVTNNMNQYTSVGGIAYSYDANGNRFNILTGTFSHSYDVNGNLDKACQMPPRVALSRVCLAMHRVDSVHSSVSSDR